MAQRAKARGTGGGKGAPTLPTPHAIRTAHKADLVKWCEALGLDASGKVPELRKRLLERVEAGAEAAATTEGEPPAKAAETGEATEEAAGEIAEEAGGAAEGPEAEEVLEVPEAEEIAVEEGAEERRARPKPILDPALRRLLELRAVANRLRPRFLRQEWYRYRRLGRKWRRPRGIDSKRRRHFKGRPPVVRIGYRGPAGARGLHPSGFQEVLVHRPEELEGLDPRRQAVRIAGAVGTRKRMAIEERAAELGLRLLNPLAEE